LSSAYQNPFLRSGRSGDTRGEKEGGQLENKTPPIGVRKERVKGEPATADYLITIGAGLTGKICDTLRGGEGGRVGKQNAGFYLRDLTLKKRNWLKKRGGKRKKSSIWQKKLKLNPKKRRMTK